MTPRVVVADPLAEHGLALLRSHLDVHVPPDERVLFDVLPDSAALIVRSRTRVTAGLLDRGPSLRLVARAGIGVDNIDVPAATERGILVINAPQGNVRSTAEHTIGLIFAVARRITDADRAVRAGRWKSGYEGVQLAGKQIGIVGVGKVGRQVAMMAEALDLRVVAHDPYLDADAWRALGLPSVSLAELLHTSDIVTIHVPIAAETRGLLRSEEIASMKDGAILINCARGGLVDEGALAEALASGKLAGAALDVFEEEPLRESPLLTAPNLVLTPHVAASTLEAQAQVSTEIAEQVVDFFAGRPVSYPINPSVLEGVQS